ncbi:bZIP transcription factor, partial [Maribacter polysiphoniae]
TSEALDLDMDAGNEIQVLSISGNDIALSNGGGSVTLPLGPVTTTEITNLTIINEDISATAAIDGSKINPVFTSNVSTTGNLQVDGNVNVTGSHSPVPDYVFQKYFTNYSSLDPEYQFNDLQSVEKFIKTNYHLPGVQSAAEIRKQGFWNLGKASKINLEKIEELFLHTIAQEKKIDQLQNENKALNQELETLKSDIALIKQLLLTKEENH